MINKRPWKWLFLLIFLFPVVHNLTGAEKKTIDIISKISKNDPAYIYAYYTGDGQDGLHLLYSQDGLLWGTLNNGNSLLKPTVGDAKLFREPSIVRDKKGIYHMVWSTGLTENKLGYASSKDLINWSDQKEIPVMMQEPTSKNAWSPELFYNNKNKTYYLLWASTVTGQTPTRTDDESGFNNRIYYTTTKDFVNFSKCQVFYDPGFPCNDPFLLHLKGAYHLFITKQMGSPLQESIHMLRSKTILSFPKTETAPFTEKDLAMGPAAIEIGKYTYVYWMNVKAGTTGAVRTKKIKEQAWENVSDAIRFPRGVKQGSVFQIDDLTLQKLQSLNKN